MLGKLLKYDFKWINKVMFIYFIISIALSLLTKLVETFEQTIIVTIIDKILVGMLISCFFSILITCLIRVWVRFKNNIYKDESYLTHTLPITKATIYNSKIISSCLSIILAILVILGCFLLVFLNNSTIILIKDTFTNLAQIFGKAKLIGMIITLFLIILLEVIYMMQAGIFGIIVGNRANNYKTLRSVLIGIMSYGILSGFTLVILYVIAKINPTLMELYSTNIPSSQAIEQLIYISLTAYIIYNLGFYFASKKILQKGVNVD